MAQRINNDLIVCGKIAADEFCGRLSDEIKAEIAEDRRLALETKADASAVRELTERYNEALKVINNLSERLAALESNYDPTVIK